MTNDYIIYENLKCTWYFIKIQWYYINLLFLSYFFTEVRDEKLISKTKCFYLVVQEHKDLRRVARNLLVKMRNTSQGLQMHRMANPSSWKVLNGAGPFNTYSGWDEYVKSLDHLRRWDLFPKASPWESEQHP